MIWTVFLMVPQAQFLFHYGSISSTNLSARLQRQGSWSVGSTLLRSSFSQGLLKVPQCAVELSQNLLCASKNLICALLCCSSKPLHTKGSTIVQNFYCRHSQRRNLGRCCPMG